MRLEGPCSAGDTNVKIRHPSITVARFFRSHTNIPGLTWKIVNATKRLLRLNQIFLSPKVLFRHLVAWGLWWCWQQRSMLHTELWSPPGFAFVTLALLHILDLLWLHFTSPFITNLLEVVKIYGLHGHFFYKCYFSCMWSEGWLLNKCSDLIWKTWRDNSGVANLIRVDLRDIAVTVAGRLKQENRHVADFTGAAPSQYLSPATSPSKMYSVNFTGFKVHPSHHPLNSSHLLHPQSPRCIQYILLGTTFSTRYIPATTLSIVTCYIPSLQNVLGTFYWVQFVVQGTSQHM